MRLTGAMISAHTLLPLNPSWNTIALLSRPSNFFILLQYVIIFPLREFEAVSEIIG
jgi:hypothetical protein